MFKKVLLVLIFSPFILQAQDCIDSTSIDPGCICFLNYDPVCGCDGELYSNPCEATQCFGVTSYVSAYDTNGNIIDCSTVATDNSICDSINVEVESFNLMTENGEVTLTINMTTFFTSSEFFGYAGFVLLNYEGDEIAEEGMDAANVYGFGANYSDTRTLYFEEFFSIPFEGTLLLYEGFFAGNPELVCSFPISFSLDGAGISLEGQYHLAEEYDYVEFTSDSLFVYDFEEDMECYEYVAFSYLASDSQLVLTNAELEEHIMVDYVFSENNIMLMTAEDNVLLDYTSFDASEWEECDEDSTDCIISNVIAEAGECDSLGYFMVDIEFDVENPMAYTFTIQGNGTNYGSFEYGEPFYQLGPFLADGETEYEFAITDNEDSECSDYYDLGTVSCDIISSITNFEMSDKRLLFIKNILGETVNKLEPNNPYIYFYDDGSFEKKIIFVQ